MLTLVAKADYYHCKKLDVNFIVFFRHLRHLTIHDYCNLYLYNDTVLFLIMHFNNIFMSIVQFFSQMSVCHRNANKFNTNTYEKDMNSLFFLFQ